MPNYNEMHFTIGLEIKDRRLRLLGKSREEDEWHRVEIEGVQPIGDDTAVLINRHLVTKALRFGLTTLEIVDPLTPVRFSVGGRQMIIMPIRPEATSVNPTPAPAATREVSPDGEPTKGDTMQTETTRGTAAHSASTANNGTAEKTAIETALGQVETVRGELRNAIVGLNQLAEALKQARREEKAGEKEIQSVRQTLRSLQSVRI
jgi:hypothetical protein